MTRLDTRNLVRRKAPAFAFKKAQSLVLPDWEISLVFAPPEAAQDLNRRLRRKTYTPNVLSYPTGKKSGEIVICLDVAKEQAPDYGMSYPHFTGYLFIHGLMHLKGRRHGSTMEKAERQVMSRVLGASLPRVASKSSNEKTHRSRNRHRHAPSKGRRR
jgi:probable rRNA maturation factor